MSSKEALTTGEIATICHVNIKTVTKWIDSGLLEGYKVPGSQDRRVLREHLISFIKEQKLPVDLAENGKKKIFVVDDDHILIELLQETFQDEEEFECHCMEKADFETGITALGFQPNLVILDIMLGAVDGREIAKMIRLHPEMKETKLLAISGVLQEKEEKELKGVGVFDAYMAKPFRPADLLKKVRKLLNMKPVQKEEKVANTNSSL